MSFQICWLIFPFNHLFIEVPCCVLFQCQIQICRLNCALLLCYWFPWINNKFNPSCMCALDEKWISIEVVEVANVQLNCHLYWFQPSRTFFSTSWNWSKKSQKMCPWITKMWQIDLSKKAFSDLPKHPTSSSFFYPSCWFNGGKFKFESICAHGFFTAEEEILRSNNDKCANPGPPTWAMSATAAEIRSWSKPPAKP